MSSLIVTFFWDFVVIIITITVIGISYIKWRYQYWKNRNIPYLEPSIPFGNLKPLYNRKMNIGEEVKEMYDKIKERKLKFCGIYTILSPVLLITDLDLIRNIMAKDFQYFDTRGLYYNEKVDPLSANIVTIGGTKWRNLRTKLTPTFSSAKMKLMFQTLVDCGHNLENLMNTQFYKPNEPINIKQVSTCFTINVIGSCAFGLDCKTFEDSNSPFRVYGVKIIQPGKFRTFLRSFALNSPKLAHFLNMRLIQKDVTDFFMKTVSDTVNYREKNNIERKDFLQLLIEIKNKSNLESNDPSKDDITLTMNEIIAQSFMFFLAGFETSSSVMTFALYELAKHSEIQDKLRNEIETVLAKYDGNITYDSLKEMKFMSQVLDEALRRYPPVPITMRKCVKDYHIPDSDVIIEKDTRVFIPVYGLHMNPEYYPNPEQFDPERFSEDNKQKRHPYAHIPFGEGPRICIGMRFGLMQSKVGLISLLRKYKFSVNRRTQQPLKLSTKTFAFSVDDNIFLDATELK